MATAGTAVRSPAGTRRLSVRGREELEGWLFAMPWILGFLIFTLGPMVASLFLSFTKYNISQPPEWIGLDNFRNALLGENAFFWPSLERTLRYALVMVPLGITLSFLVAVLLNQHLRATVFFRTFFFLPSLTPVVASAILWRWLYQPEFGAINWLLWLIGIPEGPKWLGSPRPRSWSDVPESAGRRRSRSASRNCSRSTPSAPCRPGSCGTAGG